MSRPLGLELTLESTVYGPGVALDDPAELYHEASKLYPSFIGRQAEGLARLEADPALLAASQRSVRRNPNLPVVDLPEPRLPRIDFGRLLERRRTRRDFGPGRLALTELATILDSAYGARRPAPSGGALYPLELYAVFLRVDQLEAGIYHFDPLRAGLEVVRLCDTEAELERVLPVPEPQSPAAMVAIAATFWRTRFKYGLRGYRFALLEAGHVCQNFLLACTALGLCALPLGGFYDRRADELLGLDGVNESILYPICVGPPGE